MIINSLLIFLILSSFIHDVRAKISEVEKMAIKSGYDKIYKKKDVKDEHNLRKSSNLSVSSADPSTTTTMPKRKLTTNFEIANELVGSCFSGIQNSLDPAFCWRKGKDIDLSRGSSCDPGYVKKLFTCVKECAPGYTYHLGLCRRNCRDGYEMKLGLLCYKNWFRSYFVSGYFPKRTLLNCDRGYVRLYGNMCSKSCEWGRNTLTGDMERTSMKNCGPLACSHSLIGCVVSVIQMAVDTIVNVSAFISFVCSYGTSTGATLPTKAAVAQAGKVAMKKAMKVAIKQMAGYAEKKFREKVYQFVTKRTNEIWGRRASDILTAGVFGEDEKDGKSKTGEYSSTGGLSKKSSSVSEPKDERNVIEKICGRLVDHIKEKEPEMEKNMNEVDEESFADEIVDGAKNMAIAFGGEDIVKECEKGVFSAGCIEHTLKAIAVFDPTGIVGLIATFVKPICNLDILPSQEQKAHEADKEIRSTIDTLKPGCVRVYKDCYYKGDSLTFCRDDDDDATYGYWENFHNGEWNDKISSIITAKDTFGAFYEDVDMRGRHFTMGPEESLACLKDLFIDTMNFNDFISSITVSLESRRYFKVKWGYRGETNDPSTPLFSYSRVLGADQPVIVHDEFFANFMEYVSIEPFTSEFKIQICSGYHYKGACITIDEFWEADNYQTSDKYIPSWRSWRITKNDIEK